jgi:thiol-disulfide isomerase/thioredoxin
LSRITPAFTLEIFMHMPRNKILYAGLLLAALAGPLAVAANVKVGDLFPKLADCKLEGGLPDQSKDKVVLIDFWASWCGPCKQSFPVMEELQKTYGPRGLRVIAVNVDEQRSNMEHFLKDHPMDFTVVRDGKQVLVEKADIGTMPTSFILDSSGKIRFIHSGFHGSETKKEYEREIESLLGPDQK